MVATSSLIIVITIIIIITITIIHLSAFVAENFNDLMVML
jgi:hypothetical protein